MTHSAAAMRCGTGLCLLAMLVFPLWVWASPEADGWRLRTRDDVLGIDVYVRQRSDHHREFLAITRIPARLSSLAAVLQDTQAMPRWVYRTQEVQVLETPEPTRGLLRVVTQLPWPLTERDAIVEWRMQQDPATGEIRLDGVGVPHRAPPVDGFVRIPEMESHWRLKPLTGGQVEVQLRGYAHMGGNLNFPPLRAFLSTSIWQAPLETLRGLREMVQLPAYRQAQIPTVRDWP